MTTQEPVRTIPYQRWIAGEGIPVHEAVAGTSDLTELPRAPWARTGGLATFVEMLGPKQAERGIYVCEIPGGKALEPKRHMFQEAIIVLQGRGTVEVWYEGTPKRSFEWGPWSVFSPPLNTWHRLINGSREPAIFLSINTAPKVMNLFDDLDFVFNCDHRFLGRFSGEDDYFTATTERQREGRYTTVWYTNFIPDASGALLDELEQKVSGGQLTTYRMAGGFPSGHMSEWPVGRYHKAHFHGPGAILIGLTGKGYVNVWPASIGIHPITDGYGDQLLEIPWGPRSIYSPPDGWFHQHMATSKEPPRHLAVYGGSAGNTAMRDQLATEVEVRFKSVREGGTLLDYEDEDPEIRRRFEARSAEEGVECTMPPVSYRNDGWNLSLAGATPAVRA